LTLREGLAARQRRAVYRSLALDYLADGNPAAAEQALGEILKADKSDLWAAERLLRLYEDDERWEEAFKMRSQIDRRLGGNHRDVLALYKVFAGERLLKNGGDGHKARLAFKEALSLDEGCLPAYLGIGETYYDDQQLKNAVEWWSKILEIQPRAGHLVFERLKKAYFELGQFGEITRVFEKTLEDDDKNLPAMAGLAEIARKKGDLREAESHYRRMLEIDADNITARAGLIAILKDQGDPDGALAEIEQLLQMLPLRPRGYRCASCSYKSLEPIWHCPQCKSFNSFTLWHEDAAAG
jgi:lipopolysaccharide biosynthesis regulator YciM